MEDLICEGYDLEFVPVKASAESKAGMTFKGKDGDYLAAQMMPKEGRTIFHKWNRYCNF